MVKLEPDEKALLQSVDRGEWQPIKSPEAGIWRYRQCARETFKKDARVNIRISRKDLDALQKRALEEGIPYQTLLASILHKYASGRLADKQL
ncbi:MAG: antitoxin [Dehalococcoidia bacterium]|nr:antitoxin [Dehalococcoidia bacterium]MSQ17907.1 antitoxin [Dehalococcoidia bacterium]